METETIFSDYRKVGKIIAPFAMSFWQSGIEQMKMTISEIVFNTGLDDSLFVLK
ncbi:MAG: hypothetical protein H5U07_04525 [Candidatus Aminicenantes bacterium]|nr:hypothetical protein [Candidatus Aminicenantes bacterium]